MALLLFPSSIVSVTGQSPVSKLSCSLLRVLITTMAGRALESRFERMTVQEEANGADGIKNYSKKVRSSNDADTLRLTQ